MATQAQILPNPRCRRRAVLNLAHFGFDIVSDLGIRISHFNLSDCLSCPACHTFMGQLRKTNPISKNPKPPQPPLQQRITEENLPYPTQKNKPKQTQSRRSGKKHLPAVFGAINILSRSVGPVSPGSKGGCLWTYPRTWTWLCC